MSTFFALTIGNAFRKGLASLMTPKMLFAIIMPFFVAIVCAALLLYFSWGPLQNFFYDSVSSWSWFNYLITKLNGYGFATVSGWLIGFIAFIAISAIAGVIGLAVASVAVTPMALNQISEKQYPQLEKKGVNTIKDSLFNATKVIVIFVLGWLATLPLWLIPFMAIGLSLFWGAYVFSHMTPLDAIIEHATLEERKYIFKKYNKDFWLIGLLCAAISLVPPFALIMPVLSVLIYTHYGLAALQHVREKQLITNQPLSLK